MVSVFDALGSQPSLAATDSADADSSLQSMASASDASSCSSPGGGSHDSFEIYTD